MMVSAHMRERGKERVFLSNSTKEEGEKGIFSLQETTPDAGWGLLTCLKHKLCQHKR